MTDFLLTLPPNLVLMLINAVHFKGEWVARFDPALTAKDRFYIDSKNIVDVDMMVGHKYPLSLLMDGELGAQVASFPFKANMSLLVVMPMSGKVNVSAIAAKLNTSDLYARLPSEKAMQVKLPKFKLEYGQELEDALTSMGLGSLFSAPDLSGITDSPLVVSSVQHKSSMELHEEGARLQLPPPFPPPAPTFPSASTSPSFLPSWTMPPKHPSSSGSSETPTRAPLPCRTTILREQAALIAGILTALMI
ncbi:hypothetical protein ANANG_G00156360 [Anguilla anguilla]|uniref:Serpin domain-containing protein n=1 Tax=Anguilla anguilla TaxID=7936 RepID=A0A9D3MDV4_ANGAN|nr:hypothetical protein ANANG_G00156360 [Anguilla anguilla]